MSPPWWIETEKPRVILYVGGLALALFAIVYFARVPDYTFICWFTASPRLFRPGYEKLHIEKTSRLIVATKIERRLTYALYEPPHPFSGSPLNVPNFPYKFCTLCGSIWAKFILRKMSFLSFRFLILWFITRLSVADA